MKRNQVAISMLILVMLLGSIVSGNALDVDTNVAPSKRFFISDEVVFKNTSMTKVLKTPEEFLDWKLLNYHSSDYENSAIMSTPVIKWYSSMIGENTWISYLLLILSVIALYKSGKKHHKNSNTKQY